MLRLPLVAEVGDRPFLAVRDEHRVEAEALVPARVGRDAPAERPGPAQLLAVGADRDELGDVPGAPPVALDSLERTQHPAHLVSRRAPRRGHARTAVQAVD